MNEVKTISWALIWLALMLLYLEYIKMSAGRDLRRRKTEKTKGKRRRGRGR